MEKFKLEVPTLERKIEAIEYIEEHLKYNSKINGVGSLDDYIDNYEMWLSKIEQDKDIEYIHGIGRVPAETYFLVRESDHKIIGMINIRLELNDALRKHGGHIGYGIRPTERRKGYSKINLYLALLRCKEVGIDKVMLSCDQSNLGSDKTIRGLGGILEKVDTSNNKKMNIYWIDVNDSINKYKDIYITYINK